MGAPVSVAWARHAHIHALELQALFVGLRWRVRSSASLGTRICCFLDSQVALSVAAKGRSSSHQLNRVLRRLNAFCLAANIQPFYVYVHTSMNPADAPSRLAEGKAKKVKKPCPKLKPKPKPSPARRG